MTQIKHGVFNCLTGQYEFLESKEQVAAKIVENALALYFHQTGGHHYYCANTNEQGHEYEKSEERFGTELPEDLLAEYINKTNENL
jgi:hypothetical protein